MILQPPRSPRTATLFPSTPLFRSIALGRQFVPAPEKLFTWWSYRARDWQASDRGRRLDHVWASPQIASAAKSHRVHRASRSWQKPSDHIPLITEFAF